MATVVVVGGVNLDLTVQAQSRPQAGETVVGSGPVATSGGKGANQAVAVAYAGARALLCAVVGDDAAGAEQRDQLRAAGVDVSRLRSAEGTATGTAFIVLTPDGENSIVVGVGANALLGPDDVEAAVGDGSGDTGSVEVVLAQTEPGIGPVGAAARRAALVGARFVLNAAPVEGLAGDVLRRCDPLVVNEHEAADLLREHDGPRGVPDRELARALRDHLGCRSVVVSLGGAGASVAEGETDEHVTAPSVDVVDTTGAGDVLVGVIAARLAQGRDLLGATGDACELAGRAVTTRGARGYLAR